MPTQSFFAGPLLCHEMTYAAPAMATIPMEGAVVSAAMESVRQAQQDDFNSMRSKAAHYRREPRPPSGERAKTKNQT